MSGDKLFKLGIALLTAGILTICSYYLFIKAFSAYVIYGTAPNWVYSIIKIFYPRFFTERVRFDVPFVEEMSFQLFFRLSLVFSLTGLFLIVYYRNVVFRNGISKFWQPLTSPQNIVILKWIFYPAVAWFFFNEIHPQLIEKLNFTAFYNPISFYKLLKIPYPNQGLIYSIESIFLLSIICVLFSFRETVFSIFVAICFIFLAGFPFCFEKVGHGYVLITYSLMLMPFQFYILRKTGRNLVDAWPIRLIQVCIAAAYFFSGLEKIIYSHFDFIDPESFRLLLIYHNVPLGVKLSQNHFLMLILPLLTVLVQCLFPLIFIFQKWKFLFLFSVLCFHLFVGLFMGLPGFLYSWGLCYIFFIDWQKFAARLT